MSVRRILLPILSGILAITALFHLLPWLAAIALVPLLYSFNKASIAQTLQLSSIFAVSFGLCFFSWIPISAELFNGNWFSGLFVLLVFTLVLSIYFLLVFGLYKYLEKPKAIFKNALLLGAIVVFFDYIKDALFVTMPWFDFHFGNALAGSNYTIQLAEFGGVYILSFFVVFINVLIVEAIQGNLAVNRVLVALVLFIGINTGLHVYRSHQEEGEQIKINLLTENIDPRIKWEEEGNKVVGQLLALNQRAVSYPADVNVWTETVVPWTYMVNDDFVNEILKPSQQSNSLTLLGINTQAATNQVFASAYLLNPKGAVLGRYDKNYPLAIIETGLKNTQASLDQNRGITVAKGKETDPITTPWGKMGVYICNEASLPKVARKLVASGASFLVNISNDGWFANSFIPKQHFYYNRLRAVENRRYVVANSNLGYKGVVSANGDIKMYLPTKEREITQVALWKQSANTLYGLWPLGMFILSSIIIINHKYNKK